MSLKLIPETFTNLILVYAYTITKNYARNTRY